MIPMLSGFRMVHTSELRTFRLIWDGQKNFYIAAVFGMKTLGVQDFDPRSDVFDGHET